MFDRASKSVPSKQTGVSESTSSMYVDSLTDGTSGWSQSGCAFGSSLTTK